MKFWCFCWHIYCITLTFKKAENVLKYAVNFYINVLKRPWGKYEVRTGLAKCVPTFTKLIFQNNVSLKNTFIKVKRILLFWYLKLSCLKWKWTEIPCFWRAPNPNSWSRSIPINVSHKRRFQSLFLTLKFSFWLVKFSSCHLVNWKLNIHCA